MRNLAQLADSSLAASSPEDDSHMERTSAREKHGGGGKMNAMVRPVNTQIEAANPQLFQVNDGWTTAYYVKRTAVGLEFEPLPGGFGHQERGIDPTQSDDATPVGVLGPFEDLQEAEDALLRIAQRFPCESFDIHCSQIASGICLPVKLPVEQEIARQKIAALSSNWQHLNGMVRYYTLGNAAKPRTAPFDEFGPFPCPRTMRDAMELLAERFPAMNIVSRSCGIADDIVSDADLSAEYAKTLGKLAALGA